MGDPAALQMILFEGVMFLAKCLGVTVLFCMFVALIILPLDEMKHRKHKKCRAQIRAEKEEYARLLEETQPRKSKMTGGYPILYSNTKFSAEFNEAVANYKKNVNY